MRSRTLNGPRLREIREERALTLLQLAAKVGESLGNSVAESTISNWERGTRQPTAKHFKALCEALDLPRETLLLGPVAVAS